MSESSKFAREIKLTGAFRSPAHEASVAIVRTASCVRNSLDRITRVEGISLSQFNILRILRGAGRELPTMDIADRMVEIEPGITRMVGKLEQNGLIERRQNPADARSVLCSITKMGLTVLDRLDDAVAAFEEDYLGHLRDDEIRTLVSLLADVCIR